VTAGGAAGRPRVGWHAYRPEPGAGLPPWPMELALTVERPAEPATPGAVDRPQALLVLRSPARLPSPLRALAVAAREVEAAAGVRGAVELPLVAAPVLPGLVPVAPAAALAQLAAASARGLAPPARRRQPAVGPQGVWWSSAGSVLVCDGPGGRSAQAAIALHGVGDEQAVVPCEPNGRSGLAFRVPRSGGAGPAKGEPPRRPRGRSR